MIITNISWKFQIVYFSWIPFVFFLFCFVFWACLSSLSYTDYVFHMLNICLTYYFHTTQVLFNSFRDLKGWKLIADAATTGQLEENLIVYLPGLLQVLNTLLGVKVPQIVARVPMVNLALFFFHYT